MDSTPLASAKLGMQLVATILFAAAVVHTFAASSIHRLARRHPKDSMAYNVWHMLGEVEIVFGLWAAVLIAVWSARFSASSAISYLENVNYTEAIFVFCIMAISSTRPVLELATRVISAIARCLPLPKALRLYVATLIVGPLLGSLITEPAAMTVTALLLMRQIISPSMSQKLRYATIGLLFVNVSIGGTLTHFAAPPVLMVAGPWKWGSIEMMKMFGWKAAISVILGTLATAFAFRRELQLRFEAAAKERDLAAQTPRALPWWLSVTHIVFMGLTIAFAHHSAFIIPLFLFLMGWVHITKAYQDKLALRESLLVAFFLGGLVTLGGLQDWWLAPIMGRLDEYTMFTAATLLTAVTDNAALTYLGSLVPEMSESAKYALLAGAVSGGGLTVIANAPNPAGYGILSPAFGEDGIKPAGLFLAALPYTLLASLCFLCL